MAASPEADGAEVSARESALVDAAWEQVAVVHGSGSGSGPHGPARGVSLPGGFPGYQIIRELQRGGQGVVYLAMQESTHRKVAIKVLRYGPLATAADLARFEREVELLARLRHPGIVSIHDRGTAAGCPFLVMDYVAGRPLDSFLADASPALRPTLELFQRICEAVHAAHLVGIIHRDLKPANIRVDEDGGPHVLDFGLAKLSSAPDQESSPADLTASGQFVGSLPWASPEQAEGRPDLVDLRTDVYSLGVILYFMLTGKLPYPPARSPRELAAQIVQTDPVRPGLLRAGLPADVETIVLKCLAKEPSRRYQSAGELARDVDNALAGRPIDARRDSAVYVMGRMLRRHWAATAAAAAFLLLLAGTAVTSTVLYRQTAQARLEAQVRLERAEREALKAAKVGQVLGEILSGMSPWDWVGATNARVLETLLDHAAARAAAELADEPEVRAALDDVLGRGYLALSQFARAEEHLERSLALRRSQTASDSGAMAAAQVQLAALRVAQGRREEAESLARSALEWQLAHRGEPSEEVATTLALLADIELESGNLAAAESLSRRAIDAIIALRGDRHPPLVRGYSNLSTILRVSGREQEAEQVLLQGLQLAEEVLPRDHSSIAGLHSSLATLYTATYQLKQAEPHFREALRIQRATVQGPHEETAVTLTNLATLLLHVGDAAGAEAAAREAIEMFRTLGAPEEIHTVTALVSLGRAMRAQGRVEEAEAAYEEALASSPPGYNEQRTATILANLAMLHKGRGDLEGAEALDRQSLAMRRSVSPEGHEEIAHALNNLADTLMRRGDAAGAEPLLREAVEIYRRRMGDGHMFVGNALGQLGRCLMALEGDEAEMIAALSQAVEILVEWDPPASRRVLRVRWDLAEGLLRARRFEETEKELAECERILAAAAGSPAELAALARRFVQLYESWDKPEQAEAWRAKVASDGPG